MRRENVSTACHAIIHHGQEMRSTRENAQKEASGRDTPSEYNVMPAFFLLGDRYVCRERQRENENVGPLIGGKRMSRLEHENT